MSRKTSVLRLATASAFCFPALLSSVMMIFASRLYYFSLLRLFTARLMWLFRGGEYNRGREMESLKLEFKADDDAGEK